MATVVYIEDEADIRQDVAEELREAGYDVIEAENGIDGLAAIRSNNPDLVLCDVSMPGMSGLEVLSELRQKQDRYNDLPFIFLTALADRGDIILGKKTGADDYLTKPIDLEMLLATIDTRLCQINRIEEKNNRQLVKLYRSLTGENVMPADHGVQDIKNSEDEEPSVGGLAISIVANDLKVFSSELFDCQEAISLFEVQGHNVVSMNSGRKFLDTLETGTFPDLALVTLNTVDLAAPLLVKVLRGAYEAMFPVLLLVPPDMAGMVDEEQLELFDGIVNFPCTALEFASEIVRLLPQDH